MPYSGPLIACKTYSIPRKTHFYLIPSRAMRRMAIGAVVLSTASLVSLLIVTPLLLIQIQSLHSDVISETDFCKVR